MARAVEDAGDDLLGGDALRLCERLDILGDALVEAHEPLRIAAADGDLVHIGVGRVQQAAFLRDRQHRERVRPGLCRDRRALQRVERDVDLRRAGAGLADLLANVEHGGLVALPLSDDDGAVEVERVEGLSHALHRSGVGRLFIAATDEVRGGHRRAFGDAHHFEHEHAVERILVLTHLKHPKA